MVSSTSSADQPLRNRLLSPSSSPVAERISDQSDIAEVDLDEKYHNLLPSYNTTDMPSSLDSNATPSSTTPLILPALIPSSLFKISPRTISDATLGLSDGLTVPFALTAGLAALGSSRVVVFGGLAELTAGSISMGLGGYLGAKAEYEAYVNIVQSTRTMIRRYPTHAIQVLRDSLADLGLHSRDLEQSLQLTSSVWSKQISRGGSSDTAIYEPQTENLSQVSSNSSSTTLPSDQTNIDEPRLERLLLRYVHNQCDPPSPSRAFFSGLTIALAYFCGGFVPLLPYLFIAQVGRAFCWSVVVMVISLAIFGAGKTLLLRSEGDGGDACDSSWSEDETKAGAKRRWLITAKDCTRGAAQMVLLGGIAAGAAMALVSIFDSGEP